MTTPSGRVIRVAHNPEAPIAVWAYGAASLTSFCQLVGSPLLATGVVDYKTELSNCPCVGSTGPGAAVANVEASGVVTLTAGGQARLHLSAQVVISPDGTVRRDETRVTLVPLPPGS